MANCVNRLERTSVRSPSKSGKGFTTLKGTKARNQSDKSIFHFSTSKSPHAGLNHGPQVYKTCALPLSYTGQWIDNSAKTGNCNRNIMPEFRLYMVKRSLQLSCCQPGHHSPCNSCSVRIAKSVRRSWSDSLCSRVLHISDSRTLICPHGEAFRGAVRCRRSSST